MKTSTAKILRENENVLLFDDNSKYTPWEQVEVDILKKNEPLADDLAMLIDSTNKLLAFYWKDYSVKEACRLACIEKAQEDSLKRFIHLGNSF